MHREAETSLSFVTLTRQDLARTGPRIGPSEREVHIWGIALEADRGMVQALRQSLSAEELDRVDRLASDRHRKHRVITYGALRVVLSRYEACGPHELRFERTPQGKPILLPCDGGGAPVRFNLTHSHGRALIAVAKAREVGIDLEKVGTQRDVIGLAKRFLSPEEQCAIERAAPDTRPETFVRFWVAREAALKAIGTGLTFPLAESHVEVSTDATEGRLVGGASVGSGSGCTVRFLPVEAGWMAAVAMRGNDWRVKVCRGDGA